MKSDLKASLIYDKIETIKDYCVAYLDLSTTLKSRSNAPVLLRILGSIINQITLLEQLMNEEDE